MAEVSLYLKYSQGARNFPLMIETCDKFQLEQLLVQVQGHEPRHQQKRKLVPAILTMM